MAVNLSYKRPDTGSGELRTPVTFFQYEPVSGPEPGQKQKAELYKCFAEVYSPSQKDLTILGGTGTSEDVTIRIRNTGGEYTPTNKHFVELFDYRYNGKVFNVANVRHDMQDNKFLTIVLRYTE